MVQPDLANTVVSVFLSQIKLCISISFIMVAHETASICPTRIATRLVAGLNFVPGKDKLLSECSDVPFEDV